MLNKQLCFLISAMLSARPAGLEDAAQPPPPPPDELTFSGLSGFTGHDSPFTVGVKVLKSVPAVLRAVAVMLYIPAVEGVPEIEFL